MQIETKKMQSLGLDEDTEPETLTMNVTSFKDPYNRNSDEIITLATYKLDLAKTRECSRMLADMFGPDDYDAEKNCDFDTNVPEICENLPKSDLKFEMTDARRIRIAETVVKFIEKYSDIKKERIPLISGAVLATNLHPVMNDLFDFPLGPCDPETNEYNEMPNDTTFENLVGYLIPTLLLAIRFDMPSFQSLCIVTICKLFCGMNPELTAEYSRLYVPKRELKYSDDDVQKRKMEEDEEEETDEEEMKVDEEESKSNKKRKV